jgi:hypothetical protein
VTVNGQSTGGSGGTSTGGGTGSNTGGGGGHSGGGALGWLELLVMTGLVGRGVLSRPPRVMP